MKPCRRCARHVRRSDTQCPFCGAAQSCAAALIWALAIGSVGATACGPAVATDGDAEAGETSSSTGSVITSASTTMTLTTTGVSATASDATSVDDGTSIAPESSSGNADETGSMSTAAYGGPAPDGGPVQLECDIWGSDCPPEEKCMPWANDGGEAWNATRCSPLSPDPALPGELCNVEGSAVSGIDDCGPAAMCWDVDSSTNEGTCVAFCEGSAERHACADPASTCVVANDGVIIVCLPTCDPMMPTCPDGQSCTPVDDGYVCTAG